MAKTKSFRERTTVLQNGVDTVYTRKTFDGKGTSHVFSSAEAEVFVTDARTIDEIRYPSPRPSSSRGEEQGEWDA